jgi:ribosome-associated toxin RatA of RatAB toxin-antitoxin module
MADTATKSMQVNAPLERVAAVVCDFPQYPEWVSSMRSIRVVEEYEDGYASQVVFVVDAAGFTDEYTLRYEYAEDLSRIEWTLVAPSRLQKTQNGSYDIVPLSTGGCQVTYTLSVGLAVPMLGIMKRKAQQVIMDTALEDLKRRVESLESR